MSKLFTILVLALFAMSYSKIRKTKCMAQGDSCDLLHTCCGKLRCRDYVCQPKNVKDNQIEWAPKGLKCDWFHHCTEDYECQSNRCVLNAAKREKTLAKREKELAKRKNKK